MTNLERHCRAARALAAAGLAMALVAVLADSGSCEVVRESDRSQEATALSRLIASTPDAAGRLELRAELAALLDSMLAQFPLSTQAPAWERLAAQCQREYGRDLAIATAESLVIAARTFDYGLQQPGQRATFARRTLAARDSLAAQRKDSRGLPIADYMMALADSLEAGPLLKLRDAVFEGEPTTSKHHEHPWIYYWPADVEYPVPGHVLFNMVRLVERGPNGITRIEVKGGRPEILGGGRATEVQIWLPEGYDPWQAYVDHQEYLDSPQAIGDGLRVLLKFKGN